MNIDLLKTLKSLENKVLSEDLRRAYDMTIKLRSQLLGVIYDGEEFGISGAARLADSLTVGSVSCGTVSLTIREPLPSAKELTSAVRDHWLELIHTAIGKASRGCVLPHFDKAFVWIGITTPRGTNNANVWDTSNRAINLVINNLKGVFFKDDNLEHMAFGVSGKWGEEGATIIRVLPFDSLERIIGVMETGNL